jgi:hypothetical protein
MLQDAADELSLFVLVWHVISCQPGPSAVTTTQVLRVPLLRGRHEVGHFRIGCVLR